VFVLDSLFTASQLSILKALVPLQLIYPPNMYLLVYIHISELVRVAPIDPCSVGSGVESSHCNAISPPSSLRCRGLRVMRNQ